MRKTIALLSLLLCFGALDPYPVAGVAGEDEEQNACEVRRISFVSGIARVVYGLPELPVGAYYKVQAKKFPNSNFAVNGGCVMDVENPTNHRSEADVLYCPKCRIAEAKWRAKHQKK
ncbi:MAG TPA: hypothetical protein VGB05_06540 [Pyrinomonadaceae bacterium]